MLSERKEDFLTNELVPQERRAEIVTAASNTLVEWVGEDAAREAAGHVAAAFTACVMQSKDPAAIMAVANQNPASLHAAVAIAALTKLMPGTGASAPAYLVPRKGRNPEIQYMISHRGYMTLAQRAGLRVIPVPVHVEDTLEVQFGEAVTLEQDPDNPPTTWKDLRGVAVVISGHGSRFVGWVPKSLISERRKNSASYKYGGGPWKDFPVEMAMKTAVKYAVARGWVNLDDQAANMAVAIDDRDEVVGASMPKGPVEEYVYEPDEAAPVDVVDILGVPEAVAMKVCRHKGWPSPSSLPPERLKGLAAVLPGALNEYHQKRFHAQLAEKIGQRPAKKNFDDEVDFEEALAKYELDRAAIMKDRFGVEHYSEVTFEQKVEDINKEDK